MSRSTLYYAPQGHSAETLALMRRIDQLYLSYPFYGSRQMARHLEQEEVMVGRHRVRRLMHLLGLEAIYRKPRTSTAHPEHCVYPVTAVGSDPRAGGYADSRHSRRARDRWSVMSRRCRRTRAIASWSSSLAT